MFYKARRSDTGNMWDVWLYHHENEYYLFSLCKAGEQGQWDNFSMARSPDGVHCGGLRVSPQNSKIRG